jgi:hypothetical protein
MLGYLYTSTSHSSLIVIIIIFTQNKVVSKGHVGVYRTLVDELLQFHQLKRSFNHFDKFYLNAKKFPKFSMHECNAHFCVLSISSLTSCDVTRVRQGLGQTSVFLCSKKISLALRLNSANRGTRAHHDVSSRDETSERGGGGGACVWHLSSHSLTKWCNTPPYMLVYISPNFPCGTELSSHPLPLCSQ